MASSRDRDAVVIPRESAWSSGRHTSDRVDGNAPRRQVSQSTSLVVPCCQNEMLKAKLPEMYGELEKCSKALEGYLEQKRSKFPRFYFCSNSKLLQILSQGSDPTTMNAHYETVFDALEKVDHDKKDKASDSVLKLNLNLPGSARRPRRGRMRVDASRERVSRQCPCHAGHHPHDPRLRRRRPRGVSFY
jgi:hypothetical protein